MVVVGVLKLMGVCCVLSCVQVPENSVVALVPKQVTAYNSVNNSTVSRTSASKYGMTHTRTHTRTHTHTHSHTLTHTLR